MLHITDGTYNIPFHYFPSSPLSCLTRLLTCNYQHTVHHTVGWWVDLSIHHFDPDIQFVHTITAPEDEACFFYYTSDIWVTRYNKGHVFLTKYWEMHRNELLINH